MTRSTTGLIRRIAVALLSAAPARAADPCDGTDQADLSRIGAPRAMTA